MKEPLSIRQNERNAGLKERTIESLRERKVKKTSPEPTNQS